MNLLHFLPFLVAACTATNIEEEVASSAEIAAHHLRNEFDWNSPDVHERQERQIRSFFCNILNKNLPDDISCDCNIRPLALKIGFTCSSIGYSCYALPTEGRVCFLTQASGEAQLSLREFGVIVVTEGCALDGIVNGTAVGEARPLGDICAAIKTGLKPVGGTGIQSCDLTYDNSACSSCDECLRNDGSNGLWFDCPQFENPVCLPLTLPFLRDGKVSTASITEQLLKPSIWEDVAVELAMKNVG